MNTSKTITVGRGTITVTRSTVGTQMIQEVLVGRLKTLLGVWGSVEELMYRITFGRIVAQTTAIEGTETRLASTGMHSTDDELVAAWAEWLTIPSYLSDPWADAIADVNQPPGNPETQPGAEPTDPNG